MGIRNFLFRLKVIFIAKTRNNGLLSPSIEVTAHTLLRNQLLFSELAKLSDLALRRQAIRAGERVPAPVAVDVDVNINGNGVINPE